MSCMEIIIQNSVDNSVQSENSFISSLLLYLPTIRLDREPTQDVKATERRILNTVLQAIEDMYRHLQFQQQFNGRLVLTAIIWKITVLGQGNMRP
jgi:hypothetical protein